MAADSKFDDPFAELDDAPSPYIGFGNFTQQAADDDPIIEDVDF